MAAAEEQPKKMTIAESVAAIHLYDEHVRQEGLKQKLGLPYMQHRIGAIAGVQTLEITPSETEAPPLQ